MYYHFSEHLAPGAVEPVNVDSRVAEIVRSRMEGQIDRYCLDEAEVRTQLISIEGKVVHTTHFIAYVFEFHLHYIH